MYNLDPSSPSPLYQQIVDQTRQAISAGYFQEGDRLPSIRDMAAKLLVNTSTVSKAYKELEGLGFIETITGKGTFVSLNESRLKLEKTNIELDLIKVLKQALAHGFSRKELVAIYDKVKKEVGIDA